MIEKAEILQISALNKQSAQRRSDKFKLIQNKRKRLPENNDIEVDKATLTSDENNYASKEFKSTMHSLLREDVAQTATEGTNEQEKMRTIYTAGIVNIKKCERAVPLDEEDQIMVPDMW